MRMSRRSVLLAAIAGCVGNALRGYAEVESPLAKARAAAKAGNAFAFDLYGHVAEGSDNLFYSPYSIESALAMTASGARGETARQMSKVLHLDGMDAKQVHSAFGDLMQTLNTSGKERDQTLFELVVANSLWPQRGYPFNPEFIELVRKHYRAGLEDVDYGNDTDGARQKINKWVEDATRQKIKDLIPPKVLTPLTRLVLANAIYFKAEWHEQFKQRNTKQAPFRLPDGKTVDAAMMHQMEMMQYAQDEVAQVLEIPYKHQRLSMLVVLPRKVDGLAAIEKTLSSEKVDGWVSALQSRNVQLAMPKFKVESAIRLGRVLSRMGMTDAFTEKANFEGMATTKELYISEVLHKAFVDVNEEGTEAAAATAVIVAGRGMPPKPVTFTADHPFLFVIRHNDTGAVLFVGRVMNPKA